MVLSMALGIRGPMSWVQPFASGTSDRSLSVCFLIWWVEMHSCVRLQSEGGDSVAKPGQSPWQVPGPQH